MTNENLLTYSFIIEFIFHRCHNCHSSKQVNAFILFDRIKFYDDNDHDRLVWNQINCFSLEQISNNRKKNESHWIKDKRKFCKILWWKFLFGFASDWKLNRRLMMIISFTINHIWKFEDCWQIQKLERYKQQKKKRERYLLVVAHNDDDDDDDRIVMDQNKLSTLRGTKSKSFWLAIPEWKWKLKSNKF